MLSIKWTVYLIGHKHTYPGADACCPTPCEGRRRRGGRAVSQQPCPSSLTMHFWRQRLQNSTGTAGVAWRLSGAYVSDRVSTARWSRGGGLSRAQAAHARPQDPPNRGVGWAEFLGPRARPLRPLVRARITLLLSLIHCRRSSSLRMNSAGTSHGTPEAHAGAPRMLCSRGRSGDSLPGNGAAGLLPTSTSPPWAVRACVRVPPHPTSLRRRRG